jgi:hypothetical protein
VGERQGGASVAKTRTPKGTTWEYGVQVLVLVAGRLQKVVLHQSEEQASNQVRPVKALGLSSCLVW